MHANAESSSCTFFFQHKLPPVKCRGRNPDFLFVLSSMPNPASQGVAACSLSRCCRCLRFYSPVLSSCRRACIHLCLDERDVIQRDVMRHDVIFRCAHVLYHSVII